VHEHAFSIIDAVGFFNHAVEERIHMPLRPKFARNLRRRWRSNQRPHPDGGNATGLKFPRLALPQTEDPGEIAAIFREGLPGEFPS